MVLFTACFVRVSAGILIYENFCYLFVDLSAYFFGIPKIDETESLHKMK